VLYRPSNYNPPALLISMLITIERRARCSMFARSCKHPIMLHVFIWLIMQLKRWAEASVHFLLGGEFFWWQNDIDSDSLSLRSKAQKIEAGG